MPDCETTLQELLQASTDLADAQQVLADAETERDLAIQNVQWASLTVVGAQAVLTQKQEAYALCLAGG